MNLFRAAQRTPVVRFRADLRGVVSLGGPLGVDVRAQGGLEFADPEPDVLEVDGLSPDDSGQGVGDDRGLWALAAQCFALCRVSEGYRGERSGLAAQ